MCFSGVFRWKGNNKRSILPRKFILLTLFLFLPSLAFCSVFNSHPASAAEYTLSLSTSGNVDLNVIPGSASANADTLEIISTCPLGYDVTIKGPQDNTLYKNGDSSNTEPNKKINASTGTKLNPVSILGSNLGTWGYRLGADTTIESSFIGLTNEAVNLFSKNTASGGGGSNKDILPVYFGASATSTTENGTYTLTESTEGASDDGAAYYLTANSGCASTTYTVTFDSNKPAEATSDVTGTMDDQIINMNEPTTLNNNAYALDGYTFTGWNTAADGTGDHYSNKAKVTNLAGSYPIVTLYAEWRNNSDIALLDTGQIVNAKLKSLGNNTDTPYYSSDSSIVSIVEADSLPDDFVPSASNTISASTSAVPVYAWYDSNTSTIYYQTDATFTYMNPDSNSMFHYMEGLSEANDIGSWYASSVTDMSSMFYEAGYYANSFSLDLSTWDTSSVTDMSAMFNSTAPNATSFSLNLSGWDVSNVTNMSSMFSNAGCDDLSSINFTNWRISDSTDLSGWFHSFSYNVTDWVLDLSTWDTSSVTNMSDMFCGAGYYANSFSLDLSGWDTSSVTDMSYMFNDTAPNATSFSLDLSTWDTSSVTDMSYMFSDTAKNATSFSLNLSGWDTSSVTDMSSMFSVAGDNATTFSLDLSGWDTSSVTDMSYMFNRVAPKASSFSLDLSTWDTSSVTDMSHMFYNAGNNAISFSLDLSGWDVSNVTNMYEMFYDAGCDDLSSINFTNWRISDSTDLSSLFSSFSYNVTDWVLDLSTWDTSSVTDMSSMFNGVGGNATTFSLNLSGWDTSSVTDMSSMFNEAGDDATTFSLDLSGWDTSSVTDMSSMFNEAGDDATTFSLNLSGWDTSSVTDMSSMFSNAGYSAASANWTVIIPQTNDGTSSGPISNTTTKLYGETSSIYASPSDGKLFTIATTSPSNSSPSSPSNIQPNTPSST